MDENLIGRMWLLKLIWQNLKEREDISVLLELLELQKQVFILAIKLITELTLISGS